MTIKYNLYLCQIINFSINMIQSLSITNFKNLSGLSIPELSRINLISGKNNVGKSTLLEALRLLISDAEIVSIIVDRGEFLTRRVAREETDETAISIEALSSLFTDRNKSFDENNQIIIKDKTNSISIRFIHYIIRKTEENGNLLRQYIRVDEDYNNTEEEIISALELKRSNQEPILLPLQRGLSRYQLDITRRAKTMGQLICIDSNYNNAELISKLWDAITLTDKEPYVINALKIIEPNIENLAFLESPMLRDRYPVAKIKGMPSRMPLRSMGDGINHILAITLAIVNCQNGTVLIDEIDNGLHYTVQKQLWAAIFHLSKKLNVQIFATTHSSDCIGSFSKVLNSDENIKEGRYIRLEYKSNQVYATEYVPQELDIVAAQNIEIR